MGVAPGAHTPFLFALGLDAAGSAALGRYLDLVAAWNPRVNLTGARTPAARVAILVAPVAAASGLLGPGHLLDVGSGNGSPGLVLALLRPDVRATLLEPRQRRWAFLKEAARAAGRPDVQVLRARHHEYSGPAAGTLTIRALALPLDELAPLVAPGGRLLSWGPPPSPSAAFQPESSGLIGVHALRRRPDVSRGT